MKKLAIVPIVAIAVVGIAQALPQGATPEEQVQPARSTAGQGHGLVPAVSKKKRTPVAPRGVRIVALPEALAVQLGADAKTAALVDSVAEGSDAAKAGLATYDVILRVNGTDADVDNVETALTSGRGLELRVVRSGIEQAVAIPAAGEQPATEFFSAEQLPADHPMRQLAAINALRTSYDQRIDHWSKRADRLQSQARDLARQAKTSAKALKAKIEAQVKTHMKEFETKLLARVDARLDPKQFADLASLMLAFETVAPEKPLAAAGARIKAAGKAIREAVTIPATGLDKRHAARLEQRVASVQQEMAQLFEERIARHWSESCERIARHKDRLDRSNPRRLKRALQRIEAIRAEVDERTSRDVRLATEAFSKRLNERLRHMKLPAKGEIAACLADTCAQIETMAERYVRGAERAVLAFETRTGAANERLLAKSRELLPEAAKVGDAIAARVLKWKETVPSFEATPAPTTWRTDEGINAVYDEFRATLRETINDGRDLVRKDIVTLNRELGEHRIVCEDAWRDLETLLGSVCNEAKSSCWNLDGPYLDGRFPAKHKPNRKIVLGR